MQQTFLIHCFKHPSLSMQLPLGLMQAANSRVSVNTVVFKKHNGDLKTYTNIPGGILIWVHIEFYKRKKRDVWFNYYYNCTHAGTCMQVS